MVLHWLSLHAEAWWLVSYAFIIARFCALSLCVLADCDLRDILYRQLIVNLSRCMPKGMLSVARGVPSSHKETPLTSSLEEGLSRRAAVKTGGAQEKETKAGGIGTRRTYKSTNNPYNQVNPYNHVAT